MDGNGMEMGYTLVFSVWQRLRLVSLSGESAVNTFLHRCTGEYT
jgi:hypothetical protein